VIPQVSLYTCRFPCCLAMLKELEFTTIV
jgi:hypothetical protein